MAAIRDLHISDRPREKLLQRGAAYLNDSELLAIFIRTGIKGKSAIDIAHDLLARYGNLQNILHTSVNDFCQQNGLGPAKYSQLQAAIEIAKRCLSCSIKNKDIIQDSADCYAFLRHQLRYKTNEVFATLFLDSKHQVISFEELFEGSIHSSHIYPRTLVKKALAHNASGVIFCHNHPSGNPQPSQADIQLTRRLTELLAEIDIHVIDHLIVGETKICSLKQLGLF